LQLQTDSPGAPIAVPTAHNMLPEFDSILLNTAKILMIFFLYLIEYMRRNSGYFIRDLLLNDGWSNEKRVKGVEILTIDRAGRLG